MVKLYKCNHCGNIVAMLEDSGVNPVCCGEPMHLLTPNTTDASKEKHVPVVNIKGNAVEVKIGSVTHPMTAEHHIKFIILETNKAMHVKYLKLSCAPQAEFVLPEGEKAVAAYEYCNLHSLWKKEI